MSRRPPEERAGSRRPPEERRRAARAGAVGVAGVVAVAALATTLAVSLARVYGTRLSVWATAAVAVAVVLSLRAQSHLSARARPGQVPAPAGGGGPDALMHGFAAARVQVDVALDSPDGYQRLLQPALRRAVEERLRTAHGIDAGAEPARGRAAAGEELWSMLHEPAAVAPTASQLEDIVGRIERL